MKIKYLYNPIIERQIISLMQLIIKNVKKFSRGYRAVPGIWEVGLYPWKQAKRLLSRTGESHKQTKPARQSLAELRSMIHVSMRLSER